jgi:hypothetical protein
MVADGSGSSGLARRAFAAATALLAGTWLATMTAAQQRSASTYEPDPVELDHPAIAYRQAPRTDAVAELNRRLVAGTAALKFEGPAGYLRSLLELLDIPPDSQMAVYSKTSLQTPIISPSNPRTIFFNDTVSVGWMRGGMIEVAAQDPVLGVSFYMLQQTPIASPALIPGTQCTSCHNSSAAEGVPGFILRSVPAAVDGTPMPWLGNATMDHRTPMEERWGGWYVTGTAGSQKHLGNIVLSDRRAQELPPWSPAQTLATLGGRFDTSAYLSEHSDIVALLVFEHQARAMNLITRAGWLARLAAADPAPERQARLTAAVNELVDYVMFVGETPIDHVRGSSGFAERFSAQGPRDSKGRSLRELDLSQRLMRYPCSYVVYSAAFDALPQSAREMVLRRMKSILSGEERAPRYAHLAPARQAVLEILRETKKNLPAWF